jgi:hypothetical protein
VQFTASARILLESGEQRKSDRHSRTDLRLFAPRLVDCPQLPAPRMCFYDVSFENVSEHSRSLKK